MKEECGIFGVSNNPKAALKAYLGLYALQHRGQEGAGIVTRQDGKLVEHKGVGLVSDVFNSEVLSEKLTGSTAIAHNRYSTAGESSYENVQPFLINFKNDWLGAAHNGTLVGADNLREELEEKGSIFRTSSDTEVILHLIAKSPGDSIVEMIADALSRVEGAYSILFLTPEKMIAVRDPQGFRPLCIGEDQQGNKLVCSESCAIDIINAEYIRDIKPGEIFIVDKDGSSQSIFPFEEREPSFCIFEFVYFSRPDSKIFGQNVDYIRRRFGMQLAREHPAPSADVVISVPDSSNTAALGYSQESGIPFELGLIRNHYVGRTFIKPVQDAREMSARIKYNTVDDILKDKSVVVVDDSIVRGTTANKLVEMIRGAGASEVHLRISSPPIKSPCYFGIDIHKKRELIAAQKEIKEMEKFLKVDSLRYLSLNGMTNIEGLPDTGFCTACFSEEYPLDVSSNQ